MEAKLIKHGHSYALVLNKKLVAFAHPDDFSKNNTIGKLCIDNCQAIERNFDLVDHAIAYAGDKGHYLDPHGFSEKQMGLWEGYIDGFEQALKLMGNKKFSEDDVREAIVKARETVRGEFLYSDKSIIQSLQQTEWLVEVVEIEDGEFYDKTQGEPPRQFRTQHNKHFDAPTAKLDPEGCLILKRRA